MKQCELLAACALPRPLPPFRHNGSGTALCTRTTVETICCGRAKVNSHPSVVSLGVEEIAFNTGKEGCLSRLQPPGEPDATTVEAQFIRHRQFAFSMRQIQTIHCPDAVLQLIPVDPRTRRRRCRRLLLARLPAVALMPAWPARPGGHHGGGCIQDNRCRTLGSSRRARQTWFNLGASDGQH